MPNSSPTESFTISKIFSPISSPGLKCQWMVPSLYSAHECGEEFLTFEEINLHTSDFHLKRSTPGDRLCYWGGCDYKGRRDNFQTHMFRHHFKDLPHREMCVCGYFQESLYLARLHVRACQKAHKVKLSWETVEEMVRARRGFWNFDRPDFEDIGCAVDSESSGNGETGVLTHSGLYEEEMAHRVGEEVLGPIQNLPYPLTFLQRKKMEVTSKMLLKAFSL